MIRAIQISLLCSMVFIGFVVGVPTAQAGDITHTVGYTFYGDSTSDEFGASVSGAGDVDGDGFDDVIVGASHSDANGGLSGSARVFSGADGGELYEFNGRDSGDQFGYSVSGAGDVDGDGRADLIVGAPDDDNNAAGSGSARVLSGDEGGKQLYEFNGDDFADDFGHSVSGAGDVNGDGFDDVVVGARFDDNNGLSSGSARVLSGKDGAELYEFSGDSSGDRFGYSVSGAGDVDGDGHADLIVGARLDDGDGDAGGTARVLSGDTGSQLYEFSGEGIADELGHSVSGAGDVNNDGHADLIVGAPGARNGENSSTGGAYVLSGDTGDALYEFYGEDFADDFGASVSGAGDVNGDGYDDLIVGAPGNDSNGISSGSVRVLSGFDGGELYEFDGDGERDEFGYSVSGVGDVNGDGVADFLVGARGFGLNNGGYARLFVSEGGAHAIPEPASIALLSLGAGALGVARGRRRSERAAPA